MSDEQILALQSDCHGQPGRSEPRIRLARALLDAHRPAEAVIPAEQALAISPDLAEARAIHAAVMAAIEAADPVLVRLELMAAIEPQNAEAQLALGEAYAGLRRPADAERQFGRALDLGAVAEASALLASLRLSEGRLEEAEPHARRALAALGTGTGSSDLRTIAHHTLAAVFDSRGEAEAAEAEYSAAFGANAVFPQPSPDPDAPRVLVLLSRGGGNIPYQTLLPPLRYNRLVCFLEHARPEAVDPAAGFGCCLNAVGDPDHARGLDDRVRAFADRAGAPLLNAPDRVAATARDRLADTLRGVCGAVTPETVRVATPERAEAWPAIFASLPWPGPTLVRPEGAHGGIGLVRIEGELSPLAGARLGRSAYLSRYVDYASADGYFRKYRAIFVDRTPYPYHLAISSHWMVHHQSSGMAGDAGRIAEEMAFLADPEASLGSGAWRTIAEIGRLLDLDYAGVDFSLTQDGSVLVFEANAAMLTHLEPPGGPFESKNRYIQAILDAFDGHVRTVMAGTPACGAGGLAIATG